MNLHSAPDNVPHHETQTPRWANVWLIYTREMRDQLRDRRTLFTIIILPILLYPLIGTLLLQIAQFSREYRRLFGAPPRQDVERLKCGPAYVEAV